MYPYGMGCYINRGEDWWVFFGGVGSLCSVTEFISENKIPLNNKVYQFKIAKYLQQSCWKHDSGSLLDIRKDPSENQFSFLASLQFTVNKKLHYHVSYLRTHGQQSSLVMDNLTLQRQRTE